MRGERWKLAYAFEVDAAQRSVRLVQDGEVRDTLALTERALERVALRYVDGERAWQWLLAFRGDERVRALPHDDSFRGHADFATVVRALEGFDARAYAQALTTPHPQPDALQMLWRCKECV